MSESQPDEKKIIVDEDWKSQVEAEKEKLREQSEHPDENGPEQDEQQGLPPATFETLITSMATQAMAFLGQYPDEEGRAMLSPPHAKHFIDLLAVIEEKSKGNLSEEEAAFMENLLHQLRMLYVAVTEEMQRMATSGEGDMPDLSNLLAGED